MEDDPMEGVELDRGILRRELGIGEDE